MSSNTFWPSYDVDIFDALTFADDIRDAATATLQQWLPAYVTEIGARKGLTLDPISDWKVRPEYRTLPPGTQAGCWVTCGGTAGTPERKGDGTILSVWAVEVSVLVRASDWETTEDRVSLYAKAAVAALLQHPDLGGISESVKWTGYRYAVAEHAGTRTLGVGRLTFNVVVEKVLNATAGPAQPTDPTTVPPTVQTVTVSVTGGTS